MSSHSSNTSSPSTTTAVAVLGLGAMGSRMAARLLDAGYPVTVWNRTDARAQPLREKGATVAESPRDAAARADVVLAMVRDEEASRSVWLDEEHGAVAGLQPGAVALEVSTLRPAWARSLADSIKVRGAGFLDAPVVGSRPHAEQGILTFLVGGERDALERVRPVLDTLGAAVHAVGPVGAGMAVKLAVNSLFAVQAAALAEVLATLRAAGIAPEAAAATLGAMPTASPAATRATSLMAARSFAPNFPIDLVAKDLGYAHDVATDAGVDSAVLAATRHAFTRALDAGLGRNDITGIAQLHD